MVAAERPELRHAGLMTSSAIAELETPSRVACSDLLDHSMLASKQQNASRREREDVERDADERKRCRIEPREKPHHAHSHGKKRDGTDNGARPSRTHKQEETRHCPCEIQEHKKQVNAQPTKSVRVPFVKSMNEAGEKIAAYHHPKHAENLVCSFHSCI